MDEMTGPMPTRDGDIVITHSEESRSLFLVWRVTDDGQQESVKTASTAWAMGREAALKLAAIMANESRGVIYWHDPTSGEWTRIES